MQSVVIVTAALGNRYILPSTSPATDQRFHDFPFLLRLFVFISYPACKTGSVLPKDIISHHPHPMGTPSPPLTGLSAASLAVCGPLLHSSQLSSPQVSEIPPTPAALPNFWLLLPGLFSGLTSLLFVWNVSIPGLLPWPSSHSPRHSGSISYTHVMSRLSNAVRKGWCAERLICTNISELQFFPLYYDEATNL